MRHLIILLLLFVVACNAIPTIGPSRLTVEQYIEKTCNLETTDMAKVHTWADLAASVRSNMLPLENVTPPAVLDEYHEARILAGEAFLAYVEAKPQDETANLFELIILTADPRVTGVETQFQALATNLRQQLIDGGCYSESTADTPTSDDAVPTAQPLTNAAFGDTLTINADKLSKAYGQEELAGSIKISFVRVERHRSVEDANYPCGGTMTAEGIYLTVYYTIQNDANAEIQMATNISNSFLLLDDRDRQWKQGGHQGECALEPNLAAMADLEQPAHYIPPGFASGTALVFDIPTNATGLRLVNKRWGVEVVLPNPTN